MKQWLRVLILLPCVVQVVAGVNHRITMLTSDTQTGKPYTVSAVVHADLAGKHTTLTAQASPAMHRRASPTASLSSSDAKYSVEFVVLMVAIGSAVVAVMLTAVVMKRQFNSNRSGDVTVALENKPFVTLPEPPSQPSELSTDVAATSTRGSAGAAENQRGRATSAEVIEVDSEPPRSTSGQNSKGARVICHECDCVTSVLPSPAL